MVGGVFQLIANDAYTDKMNRLGLKKELIKPRNIHIRLLINNCKKGDVAAVRNQLASMIDTQMKDVKYFKSLIEDAINDNVDMLLWALLDGYKYEFIRYSVDINRFLSNANNNMCYKVSLVINAAKKRNIRINVNDKYVSQVYRKSKELFKALLTIIESYKISSLMSDSFDDMPIDYHETLLMIADADKRNGIIDYLLSSYKHRIKRIPEISDWICSKAPTWMLIRHYVSRSKQYHFDDDEEEEREVREEYYYTGYLEDEDTREFHYEYYYFPFILPYIQQRFAARKFQNMMVKNHVSTMKVIAA